MAPLTGRALVAAMCLGQAGNLLPHVVVPAVMAQHLMPLWGLTAAQAGLMASGYTFGYMLAVPLLTTLTDRIDAGRLRSPDARYDCERGANATWRDVGVTFDGWIWSCRARRLGRRRCTRRRRRASQGIRLARTVRAAGGRNPSRPGRFVVVAAWQVMRPTMSTWHVASAVRPSAYAALEALRT
jgi:MFS family permease